jgi:hypothetical protein
MNFFQIIIAANILVAISSCTQQTESNDQGILGLFGVDSDDIEYVSIADTKENAFSLNMPKGWESRASLERFFTISRQCGVTISPDKKTRIFFGDPTIPNFTIPMPEIGLFEDSPFGNQLSQVRPYIPSDKFLPDYCQMAFGKRNSFKIVSVKPNQQLQSDYEKSFQQSGAQSTITASTVVFEYSENGTKFMGEISGVAYLLGYNWNVDLKGFTCEPSNKQLAEDVLAEMTNSFKTNNEWRQKENAAFAARMENDRMKNAMIMNQMTTSHNQRMADMQQNFNAHQQRMGQMQSSNDAYNQGYMNSQQSQDEQHRRFVDFIRGEEQVSSGNSQMKVEAGYNHYYVNQSSGEYIGTNSQFQSTPNNYEEWQIDN